MVPSYATLCLDMRRYYTQKPLVVTGEAYMRAGIAVADLDQKPFSAV
jgi:hypothetical protein